MSVFGRCVNCNCDAELCKVQGYWVCPDCEAKSYMKPHER